MNAKRTYYHKRRSRSIIGVVSSTPRAYKVPGSTEDGQREAEAVSSSSSGLYAAR